MSSTIKNTFIALALISSSVAAFPSLADGGVSIQGTRIVYPLNDKQKSISIRNSSTTDSFLVQSWTENAAGEKSKDFIFTPPLYLSGPGNENILRLMHVAGNLPKDRESLYYYIARAVPSVDDKDDTQKSVLRIAAASRIKLFVRPDGLTPEPEKAPDSLIFHKSGDRLDIENPTPYYLTLTKITVNGAPLGDIMVAPESHATEKMPSGSTGTITFHTINDYGAVTKSERKPLL